MKKQWLLVLMFGVLLIPGITQAQDDRQNIRGFLEVFLTQLDLAVQQASFGTTALTNEEAQTQAHQVLNIAVGEGDASFDATVPNLGDGVGLTTYARRLNAIITQNDVLADFRVTAENITFYVAAATDFLRQATRNQNQNVRDSRRLIHIAQGLMLAARGAPGDLPSEGGIRTLLAALVNN